MNAPFRPQGQPALHYFDDVPHVQLAGGRAKWSFILAENNHFGRAGQLVTLDLAPADVHDPTELATYLAGYRQEGLMADILSPVLPAPASTDKQRSFTKDNAFLAVDVKTSIQAKVPEVDPQTELADYTVIERACGSFIPDRVSSQSSYDVNSAAMDRCGRALLLDREIDVQTLLRTTANWDVANRLTLGATTKWNGGASSDPIANINTITEASLQRVTHIGMTRRVSNAFLKHPAVRDHLQAQLGSRGADDLLDQGESETYKLPGIPRVYVSDCKHTLTSGVAPDYTWGNDVVLATVPMSPPTSGEAIATSYTRRLAGPAGVGFVTRQFRVEDRGSLGGIFVVAAMAEIAIFTSTSCGGIIKDAWA